MSITKQKVEKWAQKNKIVKLMMVLSTGTTEDQFIIIKALGTTKDGNVMYQLIPYLKDSNSAIRAITVETLGDIGNGRSLEFVRQLWNSETDENVREKAKIAINAIKENVAKSEKH